MLPGLPLLLVLALAVALAVAVAVYEALPGWMLRHIPAASGRHWLLGHLPALTADGPQALLNMARSHGPVFRFHAGRQPLVVVADAALCREICVRRFRSFKNRCAPASVAASPLHSGGIFFARDGHWTRLRGAVQPLYQPARVAALLPLMDRLLGNVIAELRRRAGPDADVDFSDLALRLATDVIGEIAFGVRFGLTDAAEADEVSVKEFVREHVCATSSLKMDLGATAGVAVGLLFPALQRPLTWLLRRVPGTADRRVFLSNERLARRLDAVIAERQRCMRDDATDFLSVMLARAAKTGMRRDQVRALAYEHLLAGSATTAFTVAVAVYLVSAHPLVEERLLSEVDAFAGADVTAEELRRRFPYVGMVVKEAMRVEVVSPIVAREAAEDVDLGGFRLRKGTCLWLALNAVAADEGRWPDACEFRPERHEDVGVGKSEGEEEFSAFGFGARACLGRRVAEQEVALALVRLYQCFTFEHSPAMERPLLFDFGIVRSVRHSVRLRAIPRVPCSDPRRSSQSLDCKRT